ncbi:MAG: ferrous iron transport protein A [Firmicutes bacterium]|nr:ferrous iron transport protein A [Bacillota bacterium]
MGIIALRQMRNGQKGKIVELATHDRTILRKLRSLGIIPGVSVRLLRRFPDTVIEIGYTKVALDRQYAALIYLSCKD